VTCVQISTICLAIAKNVTSLKNLVSHMYNHVIDETYSATYQLTCIELLYLLAVLVVNEHSASRA